MQALMQGEGNFSGDILSLDESLRKRITVKLKLIGS